MLKSLSVAAALLCLSAQARAQGPQADAAREVAELSASVVRLYEARDFDAALRVARSALQLSEKALGPEHELTAAALNNLGKAYAATGNIDEARKLYRRALEAYERREGPHSPRLPTILDGLGLIELRVRRDPSAAESYFLRSLSIREKAIAHGHDDVVLSLRHLAAVYLDKKDPDRAGLMLRRVASVFEKSSRPGDPRLVGALQDYACLLRSQKRAAEAEAQESRAYAPLLAAAAGGTGPLRLHGSGVSCRAVDLVMPDYGAMINRGDVATETVRVRLVVDESGKVTEAVAEGGQGPFREAARRAALRSRFAPLVVEGRPVKFAGVLTYGFEGMRGSNDLGVVIR